MTIHKRRWLLGALILMIGLIAAGCGNPLNSPVSGATTAQVGSAEANVSGETVVVKMKNFAFEPATIVVSPGTRIVFENHDPTPHNVVQGSASEVGNKNHQPLFESPELNPGESWEIVIGDEGTYNYACTVAGHYLMGMEGVIQVVEGAEASATGQGVQQAGARSGGNESAGAHAHHVHPTSPIISAELPPGMSVTPEGLVELAPFRVEGNVKEFALDIQEVTHEIVGGVTVTAWAFNGVVPGPLLRVEEGDLVRVHFTNTHHQPHTIHWHGIYADQKYDGVPHTSKAIMPGESYVYEFVAEHAGTFMYHCHVDSYRHIDMGMYGAIVVDPKGEKSWDREYTLVLDDWDSNVEPMAQRYKPDHNYFLINGKAFPDFPTLPIYVGETTRVRLINAGYHNFAMHLHGPHFTVVETDGRPLPQPYDKDTIDIAPGERYDIEILPSKAGQYPFHAHNIQYVLNDGAYPGGIHLMFDIIDPEATQ